MVLHNVWHNDTARVAAPTRTADDRTCTQCSADDEVAPAMELETCREHEGTTYQATGPVTNVSR